MKGETEETESGGQWTGGGGEIKEVPGGSQSRKETSTMRFRMAESESRKG